MEKERTYSIGTSRLFHGPGMLQWILRMTGDAVSPSDKDEAAKLYWLVLSLPDWPAGKLLAMARGEFITKEIDSDTVAIIFTEEQS